MITIENIPHDEQRYPTVGDWQILPNGDVKITVSTMDDWRHMLLVAVHELVEAALCHHRGIEQDVIDQFDMQYETGRDYGDETEPGSSPSSPYRAEHTFAENVERLLAGELDVQWEDYEQRINSLWDSS